MSGTTMTAAQRVMTALGHKEPDRVPFFLPATFVGAKDLGLSLRVYFFPSRSRRRSAASLAGPVRP